MRILGGVPFHRGRLGFLPVVWRLMSKDFYDWLGITVTTLACI